ncbi:MAG: hypothetical protein NVS1B11_01210 [Terriglobales bacterium]
MKTANTDAPICNIEGFARIIEVMSFVDDLRDLSSDEVKQTTQRLCELPADPNRAMSMEEVVFWAGVATGMDASRQAQEETLDPATMDKMFLYSSLLAHSTKNAVVDMTLQQMESDR